jgi:hypothetical protein
MRGMDKGWGVQCANTGLLLAAGAMAFGSWASPIIPERASSWRDALRLESTAANDFDKRLTPVSEATQEVRRTGPGISPSLLGIDEDVLNQGSLLHSELRDQGSGQILWAGRPGSARNLDSGTPDMFKDVMNSALKATRDALFEGSDTAYFSLGGVDLSVTLRGNRRAVYINGYDVLEQEATVSKAAETPMSQAPQEIAIRNYTVDQVAANILADIRKIVTDPMAIVGAVALLGIWAVLAIASSRARG